MSGVFAYTTKPTQAFLGTGFSSVKCRVGEIPQAHNSIYSLETKLSSASIRADGIARACVLISTHIYRWNEVGSRVGASAVGEREGRTQSLPQCASIFTAELHALRFAADIAKISVSNRVVIFTDSRSAIQSLQDKYTSNPISIMLQYQVEEIVTMKTILICWVPAHVGTKGNEKADRLEKTAARGRKQAAQLFYINYYYDNNKIHTPRGIIPRAQMYPHPFLPSRLSTMLPRRYCPSEDTVVGAILLLWQYY